MSASKRAGGARAKPQLFMHSHGLLIDSRYPWLFVTRDIEVDFLGRFGLIEVKSYKRWIRTLPLPPSFRAQLLLQLYVHCAALGPRRRWGCFFQVKLNKAANWRLPYTDAMVARWEELGWLEVRVHFVTLDETSRNFFFFLSIFDSRH